MTKLYRALIAGTIIATAAGNAFAGENTFDVTFKYDKAAPMVENYDRFERTAQSACRAEVGRVGRQPLAATAKLERACQTELLTKVVTATRSEILIAYHQKKLKTARG